MKNIGKSLLNFLKKNYLRLIIFILLIICLTYELPYTIECPGGIVNIEERLNGEGINKSKGSFNLTYVSSVPGFISNLIIAEFMPDWDIVKNENIVIDGDTMQMYEIRSRIDLYSSMSASKYVAYTKAGITPNIIKEEDYVYYTMPKAKTDLYVGDIILSYDGIEYKRGDALTNYIQSKNVGDTITFKVKNIKNKEVERKAEVFEEEDKHLIGILIYTIYTYKNTPDISYNYNKDEYGPSGGLMMSLAIYNALTKEDATKGLKISGTGTIDHDGNVGAIGGVKYKILGAIKKKSDVFIIPEENYDEAMEVLKNKKSNMKLIKAKTFDQVLDEINKL